MEPIQQQLEAQAAKLDAIERSVKKTERYIAIAFWVTVLMVALPLLGLLFVVPMFINTYVNSLGGLI